MTAREVGSKVRKFLKANGFEGIKVRARTMVLGGCDGIVVSLIDPEYTGPIVYADGKYGTDGTERGRRLLKAQEIVDAEFRQSCDSGMAVIIEIKGVV